MTRAFLRFTLLAVLVPAALPAQPAPELSDTEKAVAVVNGDVITRARFDELWGRLEPAVRARYEKEGGGRAGYLETIIQKRLLLQEASSKGYDKWPVVAAKENEDERETALFELYVSETIEPRVITEEAAHAFYAENTARFTRGERVKMRLIAVSTARRMPQDARKIVEDISVSLFSLKPAVARSGDSSILVKAFAKAAQEHSEHPSATAGGDLGWVDPDKLEAKLADAARKVPERMVSGILQIPDGYALIYVEKRNPPRAFEFQEVRDAIREHLRAQLAPQVLGAAMEHARELRAGGDVRVLEENLQ